MKKENKVLMKRVALKPFVFTIFVSLTYLTLVFALYIIYFFRVVLTEAWTAQE